MDGLVTHVYAYSFIATNLDVSTPAKAVAVEAWHRMRTDIEDRIRDAKHGAALRHLPSGTRAANTVWMWGALLAVNLSACCRNWPAWTAVTDATATISAPCATGCSTGPPGWSATPGRSPYGCPQANTCWPRCWPDYAGCPSGPDHPAPLA